VPAFRDELENPSQGGPMGNLEKTMKNLKEMLETKGFTNFRKDSFSTPQKLYCKADASLQGEKFEASIKIDQSDDENFDLHLTVQAEGAFGGVYSAFRPKEEWAQEEALLSESFDKALAQAQKYLAKREETLALEAEMAKNALQDQLSYYKKQEETLGKAIESLATKEETPAPAPVVDTKAKFLSCINMFYSTGEDTYSLSYESDEGDEGVITFDYKTFKVDAPFGSVSLSSLEELKTFRRAIRSKLL